MLIERLYAVVREHSAGRPAICFCNSRKVCQQAAAQVAKQAGGQLLQSASHQARLAQAADQLGDKDLAQMVRLGVGYHDASLEVNDKRSVERLFAEGALLILCATTGLAQGVNLPARLVVLMNTAKYSSSAGGYEEYTRIETMQMAGRAGRPQFDDQGVCVVMTREDMRSRYERMLGGTETIESHMHEGSLMLSHLNAEIAAAAGTFIPDIAVCLQWLKSTFMYVRMRATKRPSDYNLRGGLDASGLDAHLRAMLTRNLTRLAEHGMIRFSDDGMGLQPLLLGQIMARFVVDFDTVSSFREVDRSSDLEGVVSLLARATEFSTPLYLRHTEKKAMFAINQSEQVRFPIMEGKKRSKIKTAAMKASLLIQLRAGGHPPNEFHSADFTLTTSGGRILNALVEYLTKQEQHCTALHAALVLRRSLVSGFGWHDDPLAGLRQIDGIGAAYAAKLAEARLGSLEALASQQPYRVEMICGKHGGFGAAVLRAAHGLLASAPALSAQVSQGTTHAGQAVQVTVQLRRHTPTPAASAEAPPHAKGRLGGFPWVLLATDSRGQLLLIRRLSQATLDAQSLTSFTLTATPATAGKTLIVRLVHANAHGLDRAVTVTLPFGVDSSPLQSAVSSSKALPLAGSRAKLSPADTMTPAPVPPRAGKASAAAGKASVAPTFTIDAAFARTAPTVPPAPQRANGSRAHVDLLSAAAEPSSDEEQDAGGEHDAGSARSNAGEDRGGLAGGACGGGGSGSGGGFQCRRAAIVAGEGELSAWDEDYELFGEEPPPRPSGSSDPSAHGLGVRRGTLSEGMGSTQGPPKRARGGVAVPCTPQSVDVQRSGHLAPRAVDEFATGAASGAGLDGGAATGSSSCATDAAEDQFWEQFRATPQSRATHKLLSHRRSSQPATASRSGGSAVGATELSSRRIDDEGEGAEVGSIGSGTSNASGNAASGGSGGASNSHGMVGRFQEKMGSIPATPVRRMPIQPLNTRLQPGRAAAPAPPSCAAPFLARAASASHAIRPAAPPPAQCREAPTQSMAQHHQPIGGGWQTLQQQASRASAAHPHVREHSPAPPGPVHQPPLSHQQARPLQREVRQHSMPMPSVQHGAIQAPAVGEHVAAPAMLNLRAAPSCNAAPAPSLLMGLDVPSPMLDSRREASIGSSFSTFDSLPPRRALCELPLPTPTQAGPTWSLFRPAPAGPLSSLSRWPSACNNHERAASLFQAAARTGDVIGGGVDRGAAALSSSATGGAGQGGAGAMTGFGAAMGSTGSLPHVKLCSTTHAGGGLDARSNDRSAAAGPLLNADATAWLSSLLKSPPEGSKARGGLQAKASGAENGPAPPIRSMTNLYGAESSAEAVRRSHVRPTSVPLGLSSAQSITRLI